MLEHDPPALASLKTGILLGATFLESCIEYKNQLVAVSGSDGAMFLEPEANRNNHETTRTITQKNKRTTKQTTEHTHNQTHNAHQSNCEMSLTQPNTQNKHTGQSQRCSGRRATARGGATNNSQPNKHQRRGTTHHKRKTTQQNNNNQHCSQQSTHCKGRSCGKPGNRSFCACR